MASLTSERKLLIAWSIAAVVPDCHWEPLWSFYRQKEYEKWWALPLYLYWERCEWYIIAVLDGFADCEFHGHLTFHEWIHTSSFLLYLDICQAWVYVCRMWPAEAQCFPGCAISFRYFLSELPVPHREDNSIVDLLFLRPGSKTGKGVAKDKASARTDFVSLPRSPPRQLVQVQLVAFHQLSVFCRLHVSTCIQDFFMKGAFYCLPTHHAQPPFIAIGIPYDRRALWQAILVTGAICDRRWHGWILIWK